jgi:hypothetical protein
VDPGEDLGFWVCLGGLQGLSAVIHQEASSEGPVSRLDGTDPGVGGQPPLPGPRLVCQRWGAESTARGSLPAESRGRDVQGSQAVLHRSRS